MKRLLCFLLAVMLMLAAAPALGEDVFTVRELSGSYESDRSYLCITCPVADDSRVTVTVTESGGVTYQRDYGVCSGTFRSEDVYLRLKGAETLYSVSVSIGGSTSSFTVRRVMPRLTGNAACSVGYPLSALTGSGGWKSATLLDLNALNGSSLTVPMHASGAYELGTVTFSVSGGRLTVSAQVAPGADGEIDKATVYVATNPIDAQNLGTRSFNGLTGKLNSSISLGGASYAAVYVKLTVSFDPASLPGSPAMQLGGQSEIWQKMLQEPPADSVG